MTLRQARDVYPGDLLRALAPAQFVASAEGIDPGLAVAVLSETLRFAPNDPSLWLALSQAYIRLGEPKKATDAFLRAWAIAPRAEKVRQTITNAAKALQGAEK